MERSPFSGHRIHGRRGRVRIGAVMAVLAAGALTVTGLAGNAQAADINVAKNAGFESGLANWTCSGGSGTTVSPRARGHRRPQGHPPARTPRGAPRPWP